MSIPTEHPLYPGYFLARSGVILSAKQGGKGDLRPLKPETHRGRPRVALRWRGKTLKIGVAEFTRTI